MPRVPAGVLESFNQNEVDTDLIIEHLPLAVLVVDSGGRVRHVNRRASDLAGYSREELLSHSVLDFIAPEDHQFLIESLAFAARYTEAVMGPSRIRIRHANGEYRWSEYWAYECPSAMGFEGYVVTMAPESVTDNMANATYQIASDEPLLTCLTTLARAVSGYPLVATGAMLVASERLDDERMAPQHADPAMIGRTLVGQWPEAIVPFIGDRTMPWHEVFDTAMPCDVDVDALPSLVAEAARSAGYRSIWVRPVMTRQSLVVAAFVAWRYEPGFASPNQDRHLDEVVSLARLAFDNEEHRRQLELAAVTDPLTGLGNRAGLARRLRDVAGGGHVAVLYVDLDGFKQVNDTYGHAVGDQVITATGQRLRSVLREADAVYRVGGDEFVVVCHDISDELSDDASRQIASRIVERLGAPFRVDGALVTVGASVGIARREGAEASADLLRRADQALLRAKREGKSRWSAQASDR